MIINRQELLQVLIEKFAKKAHGMNSGQSFPFGNCILRKQQIMILFFVFEKKEATPVKEIAKFLNVTPGAVTQFVDTLVEQKLVKREESLVDRRSINIRLTDLTEKEFNDFWKKYLINASKAFVNFNDKDLTQFTRLLEKIKVPSAK